MSLILRRKCCCTTTCPTCQADIDGNGVEYPAVSCPPISGVSVTISGITIVPTMYTENGGSADLSPSTISGTFCLVGARCSPGSTEAFTLSGDAMVLNMSSGGDPLGTLRLRIALTFVCAQSTFFLDADFTPHVYAFIEGYHPEHGHLTIFSSYNLDTDTNGNSPWDRSCPVGGHTLTNTLVLDENWPRLNQDYLIIGSGGTITTNGPCTTNCNNYPSSSLLLAVSTATGNGDPNLDINFSDVLTQVTPGAGDYTFDGPRYYGTLSGRVLVIRDKDRSNIIVATLVTFCDGQGDTAAGNYVEQSAQWGDPPPYQRRVTAVVS